MEEWIEQCLSPTGKVPPFKSFLMRVLKQSREMMTVAARPHSGFGKSLPAGVSEARPTTNHMNLPPLTHKQRFDWLELVLAYDLIG